MYKTISGILSIIAISISPTFASQDDLGINFQDPNGDQGRRIFRATDDTTQDLNADSPIISGYPTGPVFTTADPQQLAHIPLFAAFNLTRWVNTPQIITDKLSQEGISPSQTYFMMVAQTLPGDQGDSLYLRPQFLMPIEVDDEHDQPTTLNIGLFYSDTGNATISNVLTNEFGAHDVKLGYTRGNDNSIAFNDDTLVAHNIRTNHGQSVWSCIYMRDNEDYDANDPFDSAGTAVVTLHLFFDQQQSAAFIQHVLNLFPAGAHPSRDRTLSVENFKNLLAPMNNQHAFRDRGGHLAKVNEYLANQVISDNLQAFLTYSRLEGGLIADNQAIVTYNGDQYQLTFDVNTGQLFIQPI